MAGPVNAQLIAKLLRQHAEALHRYAAQWTVFPDDCVQEAFVKLAGQTELPDSLVAWLYRVVKNTAINRAKSERRRSKYEQQAAEKLAADRQPDSHQSFQIDEQKSLEAVLDGLSAGERELVVLRIWSELTWKEIGDLTDQSSSSAQRCYVAVLKKLKKKLEQPCPQNPIL